MIRETKVWTPGGIGHWPKPGDRVLIRGEHPHAGKVGTVIGLARPEYVDYDCPVIGLASGVQFFITNPDEWKAV